MALQRQKHLEILPFSTVEKMNKLKKIQLMINLLIPNKMN